MSERTRYGCDYNAEQWPRPVWDEDVRLMVEAGVDLLLSPFTLSLMVVFVKMRWIIGR